MLKRTFFFVAAITISFCSISQSREESTEEATKELLKEKRPLTKHRIGLNIGGSTALGVYSDIDQSSSSSGYAEGGLSLALSYQYSFNENFAGTFLYGSAANKFAAQAFVNQLSFQEPNLNWRVEANPYGIGFMMFGVKASYGDGIKAYVNPMIGFGSMIAPLIDITADNGISSVDQRIRESDPSGATMIGLSFGIDFSISKLISINLDGTYLTSEFDIDQEFETFDDNGSPIVLMSTYTQPYSAIIFNVGIGFNF